MRKVKYGLEILLNIPRFFFSHPREMLRETSRLTGQWFLNQYEQRMKGVTFETHCHSNYSYDCDVPFEDIVFHCMEEKINILSLTDHSPKPRCFDDIVGGRHPACEIYKVNVHPDKRSLTLKERRGRKRKLALLRSSEYPVGDIPAEIGIHGFSGTLRENLSFIDAIKKANNMGAGAIINHPYYHEGAGYHGKNLITKAIESGALALEKNSTELMMYTILLAERDAVENKIPLIPGGDSHYLEGYGNSGIIFPKRLFRKMLKRTRSYTDTIKTLIRKRQYTPYFNYLPLKSTIKHIIDHFRKPCSINILAQSLKTSTTLVRNEGKRGQSS